MGDGFQALEIILFALIAAFLVLRLRSVLGRRTGHQRRPSDNVSDSRREAQSNDNVVELPDRNTDMSDDPPEFENIDPDDPIAAGLNEVKNADSSFDPSTFTEGAKAAFEIVVQAFADGDKNALRGLLNDEVLENFSVAIDERENNGETLETTVIGIKKAEIIEARIDGRTAFVTVKVISEQVNVTRDKDDAVVDGDENLVADVTDIWTFARNTRARDPNWTLVETRSPN
ncbi:MAG: translocase [Rhodospirillaceae bacterium]|nr:translocase [Rhodospirillaceae bacterium]|tara:strand:- start:10544 stop:11233 length:690 start_codon:yes stop_codon:yes gene_type:complete